MTTTKSQMLPLDTPEGASVSFLPAKESGPLSRGARPVCMVLLDEERERVEYNSSTGQHDTIRGVVTVPYWVVVQSSESVHQDLELELQQAQHAEKEAAEKLRQSEADRKTLEKEVKKARAAAEDHEGVAKRHWNELVLARESKRRYETDLSRLRSALGELRMKEILGDAG